MATRSDSGPRSRASSTRALPRVRARAYAGSRRISSRLTFSERMKAEASKRNGYFARVASSTLWERCEAIKAHGGEPRNELRARGLDVLRRPTRADHPLSGAPRGGGLTPSCRLHPAA